MRSLRLLPCSFPLQPVEVILMIGFENRKLYVTGLSLAVLLIAASVCTAADLKTRNVVLITTDGLLAGSFSAGRNVN